MRKLVLITGSPGTGKSSVSHAITQDNHSLIRVSFGEVLYGIVTRDRPGRTSYSDLRMGATRLAQPQLVHAAQLEVEQVVSANLQSHDVLLDSHSVIPDGERIRFISDTISLRFSLVICLYTDYSSFVQRMTIDDGGREISTRENFNLTQQLQHSVAINYGQTMNCPVYFIESSGPLIELCENVKQILRENEIL